MVSQIFVVLLFLDALWVAYGLSRKKVMWDWIVLYWVLLTFKNLSDIIF